MFQYKLLAVIIISLFTCQSSLGQTVNVGGDNVVNSTTSGHQCNPTISVDSSSGLYYVVWESISSGVYNVYGKIINRSGTLVGSDFLIGNKTNGRFPDIDANKNGDVVITWSSYGVDGDGHGIYGRLSASNGTLGSGFDVNSTTAKNQKQPKVAISSTGSFVVVWASEDQDGSDFGIYGQRFSTSGSKVGSEFLVNDTTSGYQGYPDVDMAEDGSFVVTWQSNGTDGSGNGVYAKRYTSSGAAVGSQFLVNTFTSGNQQEPSVSIKRNGNFGIVWSSYSQDGHKYGVFAKFYGSTGTVINSEFQVNTLTDGNQGHADISSSPGGRYLISYTNDTTSSSNEGIYFVSYNTTGAQSFTPMRVNSRTSDLQQFPSLSSYTDDTLMIVYQDGLKESNATIDGSDYGIVSHLATLSSVPVPVHWLTFIAEAIDNTSARLYWSTAMEKNSSHFVIERNLFGTHFTEVNRINGKGNSNNISEYNFIDSTITKGTTYANYRIKQVDYDGTFEYSEIRKVEFDGENQISKVSIYPNPILDGSVIIKQLSDKESKISVVNALGKVLYTGHIDQYPLEIDLSEETSGMYFIIIGLETYKIIKH